MPRTKGSKNRPKTNITKDYATQIAEKQETVVSLNTEIASITANIDTLKADLKESKINQWIEKIETGELSEEKAYKIIGLIGEPLVRRNVEKMVRRQYKKLEPVKGRESIRSEVTEEKKKMIEFLERQKAEIEKQIKMLRGI